MTRFRNRNRATIMVVATLAMVLAGCSSTQRLLGSVGLGSSSQQPSNLVGTPPVPAGPDPATGIDPNEDCPSVTVRAGASTYNVNTPGADRSALELRYQATITRMARECAVLGATMTIKVGVEGRVILGPNGSPGEVVVPLRYAVVQEGVEPRTIMSKFYRVPVTVPPGQGNVPFTHVEEDLTFPTPSYADLQKYVIYVGFDPQMMEAKKKPRRSRKTRGRAPRPRR